MTKMSKYLAAIAIPAAFAFTGVSCHGSRTDTDNGNSAFADSAVSVTDIANLRNAILGGTPDEVASQFSYPLERPYPLRCIRNSKEMADYLPMILDDSLRTIISNATPEKWIPVGWRGWTPTEDGKVLWWDGTIYALNYVSKAEKSLRDMLVREDIESLHPSLREGWQPYYCLLATDNGTIFRIDISNDAEEDSVEGGRLRILSYTPDEALSSLPSTNLTGEMEVDGSAGNRVLHFTSEGTTIDFIMDQTDDSRPEIEVTKGDTTVRHPVEAIYWRDFSSKPRHHKHDRHDRHDKHADRMPGDDATGQQ